MLSGVAVSGFHVAWNFAQGSGFGFLVSGKESPGGSLVALQAKGNELLAGGDVGPEGSVLCTAVLLLLLAAVLINARVRTLAPEDRTAASHQV